MLSLLAGFAIGIVDPAGLDALEIWRCRHDDRRMRYRRSHRDRIEFAVGTFQRRFLHMGRRSRPQIVGGLEAAIPGETIECIELLAGRIGDIEVERLRLVDPFLPPCRRLDQPGAVDLERGGIERLEIIRYAIDLVRRCRRNISGRTP